MKKGMIKTLSCLFVIIILILSIVPFIWIFASSFKLNGEILSGNLTFPSGLHIKNYLNALNQSPIIQYFFNSVFVSVIATLLNLLVMGMAGYILARADFKLKGFFQGMFSLALLIPGAALLLPLYTTIKTVGLYDSKWGLILVYSGFGIATSLFILTSYFKTIPQELEEAAYIDGAGFLYTYLRIIAPLAKPAFATAGVLEFLTCWNEFQFALTLTTGHTSRTLPVALFYFKSAFSSDYGALFAATVMISLPGILIYLLMQKQVEAGMTGGALKG